MKPLLIVRTIFGLNLQDISNLSKVSIGTLSEVENGKMPSPKIRRRIVDAFKVAIIQRLTEDRLFPQPEKIGNEARMPSTK